MHKETFSTDKKNFFSKNALLLLKLALGCGVVAWLLSSDRIDPKSLTILWTKPIVSLLLLFNWTFGALILVSLRWRLLLKHLGLLISRLHTIRVNAICLFFALITPGIIGLDAVRVWYVCKDKRGKLWPKALLSVFLDRLIGLAGLFLVSFTVIISQWSKLPKNEALNSMLSMSFFLFLALLLGLIVIIHPPQFVLSILNKNKEQKKGLRKMFADKILDLSLLYQKNYLLFSKTIFLSMAAQALYLFTAVIITLNLVETSVHWSVIAAVIPLAVLSLSLPIAPAGIGVGHLVFDHLYHLVGLTGGANVFNILMLGQIFISLLGLIPYLTYNKKLELKSVSPQPL